MIVVENYMYNNFIPTQIAHTAQEQLSQYKLAQFVFCFYLSLQFVFVRTNLPT